MRDELNPLISVYMPTHNRCVLLPRAINSVLNQNYSNFELIIVNDCSSDDTQKVLESFSVLDKRIKFINVESPKGACYARNLAIINSNGKYITGIDDDDEWLPHRLSTFLNCSHLLQEKSFFYADDFVNGCEKTNMYPKKMFDAIEFQKKNIVGNQVFSLAARFKNNLFDTDLPSAQDYDCFFRMSLKYGDAYYIKKPLQIIYVDNTGIRITTGKGKVKGYLMFLNKHKQYMSNSSRKYQIFNLLKLKNKNIPFKLLLKLFTLRNLKRYLF